jgi:hypothetical protein
LYRDPATGFEYEPDRGKNTWHEIDPTSDRYRDIDQVTGQPLRGHHGTWRPLK